MGEAVTLSSGETPLAPRLPLRLGRFTLCEELGAGGMARRLMNLAASLLGGTRGGLAYVNTLTCMLFGSISGSAAASIPAGS